MRRMSATIFSSRLADTGTAVLSSWAKSDTLYSSINQNNASRATRLRSDVRGVNTSRKPCRVFVKRATSSALGRSRSSCRTARWERSATARK